MGEVWVPFVEDEHDPDAIGLRARQDSAAEAITRLAAARLAADGENDAVRTARMLAANSSGNATATDRLLGRNGRSFRGTHDVRYLPSREAAENVVQTGHPDVVAHVLGPSRDPNVLKRMDPPASARWLSLDSPEQLADPLDRPLFAPVYVDAERPRDDKETRSLLRRLRLERIGDDDLLAAASILENAVNNTSVFFVLDVAGVGLLFPGDSQQGAWEHVLGDPQTSARIADVAFVKIAHHGSGNATPRSYVESVLPDNRLAMLPWGLVKRWADTIPQRNLMAALAEHHHTIVRADEPHAGDHVTVSGDGLWSEITIALP